MGSYRVSRTTTVAAPPDVVHAFVDDLRRWQEWSPWEGLDPDLQRTYSAMTKGVGASYAWSGNRKAGQGEMTVVRSTPQEVEIDLTFRKPFRSRSDIVFSFRPSGAGTEVEWAMTGEQTGVQAVLGRVVPMDRLVGKDFERGLARLGTVAEAQAGHGT